MVRNVAEDLTSHIEQNIQEGISEEDVVNLDEDEDLKDLCEESWVGEEEIGREEATSKLQEASKVRETLLEEEE